MAEKELPTFDRTYENLLGHGSFATVYKARYKGEDVAVKVINRHMIPEDDRQKVFDSEIVTFAKNIRHPNVIEIFDYEDRYPGFPEVWIVMEKCHYSLDKYIEKEQPNGLQIVDILKQGSHGLAFLHSNNIVHRDVKPNNFLIKTAGSGILVKIADFSISKDLDPLTKSTMMSVHGNRFWIAPELFDENSEKAETAPHKRSIDVFSFGLVIVFACMKNAGRRHLFSRRIYIGEYVQSGKDIFLQLSDNWQSVYLKVSFETLLRQMLSVEPCDRPPMHDVVDRIPSDMHTRQKCSAYPENLESNNITVQPDLKAWQSSHNPSHVANSTWSSGNADWNRSLSPLTPVSLAANAVLSPTTNYSSSSNIPLHSIPTEWLPTTPASQSDNSLWTPVWPPSTSEPINYTSPAIHGNRTSLTVSTSSHKDFAYITPTLDTTSTSIPSVTGSLQLPSVEWPSIPQDWPQSSTGDSSAGTQLSSFSGHMSPSAVAISDSVTLVNDWMANFTAPSMNSDSSTSSSDSESHNSETNDSESIKDYELLSKTNKPLQDIEDFVSQEKFSNGLASMPMIGARKADKPIQFTHIASHRLGFKANTYVGIGGADYVFLSCEESNTFSLYTLHGSSYQQLWRKPLPTEMDCKYIKYVANDRIIMRDWRDKNPTLCWNMTLSLVHQHMVVDNWPLVGVLPPHTMVYCTKPHGLKFSQLCIHGHDGPAAIPMTLNLPPPRHWIDGISVCRNPKTQWIAVCEYKSGALDIFDESGHHRQYVKLDFAPAAWNAICCTEDYLIINAVASTDLNVYTWTGVGAAYRRVQDMVPIDSKESKVCGIGMSTGNVMHVAMRNANHVTSLHAFRME